jgi:hypothetical protein
MYNLRQVQGDSNKQTLCCKIVRTELLQRGVEMYFEMKFVTTFYISLNWNFHTVILVATSVGFK